MFAATLASATAAAPMFAATLASATAAAPAKEEWDEWYPYSTTTGSKKIQRLRDTMVAWFCDAHTFHESGEARLHDWRVAQASSASCRWLDTRNQIASATDAEAKREIFRRFKTSVEYIPEQAMPERGRLHGIYSAYCTGFSAEDNHAPDPQVCGDADLHAMYSKKPTDVYKLRTVETNGGTQFTLTPRYGLWDPVQHKLKSPPPPASSV